MMEYDIELPQLNDGRFFVSPILGCTGTCAYCYLNIKNYRFPRKNPITVEEWKKCAQLNSEFKWGTNGTIISVGAWGDIFPFHDENLIQYSVSVIKALLSWGNPVQIMSKNSLDTSYIKEIASSIMYEKQLLYSTTITSLEKWRLFESGTADPVDRLRTCMEFKENGVVTNVLLKPFLFSITDIEIEQISRMLIRYGVDYCTLGVMYNTEKINYHIQKNTYLRSCISKVKCDTKNHLDCNGEETILSTDVGNLMPYVTYLRKKGIQAYLKSSCVTANVLQIPNPSEYYLQNNAYCINCGNCKNNILKTD